MYATQYGLLGMDTGILYPTKPTIELQKLKIMGVMEEKPPQHLRNILRLYIKDVHDQYKTMFGRQ